MDLSIILINYNSYPYTEKCLESIEQSVVTGRVEIIVVDNASEKDPRADIEKKFPSVKYIRSEVNVGFAKGNNLGILHATGTCILLLNNDTLLQVNTLQVTYDALLNAENIGALTCQLQYPDGKLQHNCQSFPSNRKKNIEKFRLHKLLSRKKRGAYMQGFYWDYTKSGYPEWIWGTYFMFKKEILQKLPGHQLNDEYFMYIEDMQWCWDIRKAGYTIFYTPDTFVTHFGGGSGGAKAQLMEDNLRLFIKKNYGPGYRK